MKSHTMKLMSQYFNFIKDGTKRIELRLNDEKRKEIKIGDEIIFKDVNSNLQLKTKVINLYYEENFKNLIDMFDISIFADSTTTKEDLLNTLNEIYPTTKQKDYGVVGIEIELLNI